MTIKLQVKLREGDLELRAHFDNLPPGTNKSDEARRLMSLGLMSGSLALVIERVISKALKTARFVQIKPDADVAIEGEDPAAARAVDQALGGWFNDQD